MAKSKVTARKYEGDDMYSWAVFIDDRPIYTGLDRASLPHYKKMAKEIVDERAAKQKKP